MEIEEAVSIIEEMIQSLKNNPNQFDINVTVTGQQNISHGRGTALSITAKGGGPGSTTIGQKVSVDVADVHILQNRGKQVINAQFNALLQTLDKIARQLQSSSPDKNVIKQLYNSLKNTWVPDLIVSIVGSLLNKAIGLLIA